MEIANSKSYLAYIVDDDPYFVAILRAVLNSFSIKTIGFTNTQEYFNTLVSESPKPNICFVDLNIARVGEGLEVVKHMKSNSGTDQIPLVVVSSQFDFETIEKAAFLGANDYIVKPLDNEILASKLSPYIINKDVSMNELSFFQLPKGGVRAAVETNTYLEKVTEVGLYVLSPHIVFPGTKVTFKGGWLESELGYTEMVEASVLKEPPDSNLSPPPTKYNRIYLEFDDSQTHFLFSLRNWLLRY